MSHILLQTYDNYVSAHIAMGRLEEEGVVCWLKDENTVTIDPILGNAIGGIKLMVDATQAERAASILKKIQRQNQQSVTCPFCGSHNVELVSTPRKPRNWIMAIFGYLTAGYALSVDKVNHCFDCGKEFPKEELA